MKFILFITVLSIVSIDTFSQSNDSIKTQDLSIEHDTIDGEVYTIVESMPEFSGGQKEMFMYLAQNIRYPVEAKANGIQGKVFVNFIVGKEGEVRDVKVIRSIDPYLDAEAVRVVSEMPNWTPGTQRGNKVSVSYNLPITFKLGIENLPPKSEAEKLLEQAIKFHEKKNYEKAIELYTTAINKNETFVIAYYNRGLCYNKINNLDKACKDWNEAKKMGEKDAKDLIKKYCKD